MKVAILRGECYPCYSVWDEKPPAIYNKVDIPKEKVEWINKVQDNFDEMQEYLQKIWKEQIGLG